MKSDKDKKTSESQRARRFWRGLFRSDNVKLRKRKEPRFIGQDGGLQKERR
jgi:hypothetical protein